MFSRFLARLAALGGWRALAASYALGLLAAAAMPPVHAVPVLLLSIPGLLALIGAAPSWRRAAVIGLFWGWGHFTGGLYWITYAILVEVERFWWLVPLAAPGLALPLGLFVAAPAAMARLVRAGWPRLLVFAGAWVGAELLRGVLFTGFPWNLMGSVWAFGALPLQAASVIGVHGLSLATILLAGLPLLGRRALLGGAAAVAALGLYGVLRLGTPAPPDQPVRLLIIQANIAQELKWREDARIPILRRYLEETRQAAAEAATALGPGERLVVVWPETAVPFLLADDAEIRAAIAAVLPPEATLISGTVRVEWGPDRQPRRVFNSLVGISAAGEVLGSYDKVHLVPFGEYMPLQGLLPIRLAAGALDFTPGPGLRSLSLPGLPPFGALICYEVIFPGAVVPPLRPDWLVNVTNDGWFGISAGPWQHLATARLRAVEEGLPVVRAAQTGVSAVFGARGERLVHAPLGEVSVIISVLPGMRVPTVFSRLGIAIPGLLAALSLASGVWLGRRRR